MSSRIALLTEDRVVTMLATRALQADHQLRAFQTSDAGWVDALSAWGPEVVVLRGSLALGSAIDAMGLMRANDRLRSARFVVLSNSPDNSEPCMAAGAAAFVVIPFTADHLRDTVARVSRAARTILYVDDARALHEAIVPHLREDGYTVVQAYDGLEALSVLTSGRHVDLILSDVEMPHLDGLGLCQQLKASPHYRDIPVLLLTSLDSPDAVQRGFSAGADDYLMKPPVVPEVVARARRFLDRGAPAREELVLLVESDAATARLVERTLATHGLRTQHAATADQARKMLQGGRYDVAIIDCALGGEDGVSLVRELREQDAWADLPVIMTSPVTTRHEAVRVRSVGPRSFVPKPFVPDRLLAEVERALAELRVQRQARVMRQYLSDDAAKAVERNASGLRTELRAERTSRVILFADIVGFTGMCESMSPASIVQFLNEYFDEAASVLVRHGASIDTFVGDCIMALFPTESTGADHAVQASLELLERLPGLRLRTGVDLHVRIGINAGPVIMGDFGSAQSRRDFTVIGDEVNIASRLQSSAGRDELVVSESVAVMLMQEYAVDEVGYIEVKGRVGSVRAFRVRRGRAGQPRLL